MTNDKTEMLVNCLAMMVDLFDHAGLNGLMLSAKKHGWTKEMVYQRINACRISKDVLDLVSNDIKASQS